MHLSLIISHFLQHHIPFASWRLPESIEIVTSAGNCIKTLSEKEVSENLPAFVMSPFDLTPESPFVLIKPAVQFPGLEYSGDLSGLNSAKVNSNTIVNLPHETAFIDYINQCTKLISELQQGKINKVVLSRVVMETLKDDFDPALTFIKLCEKYPSAFIYLISDGEGLQWMGASPETLLEIIHGKGKTMSLAGTRSHVVDELAPEPWPEKEQHEQNLVTEMIRNTLQNQQLMNVQENNPVTLSAGPVSHLMTSFNFDLPPHTSGLKLALALHPTPAVCGMPTQLAKELIHLTETHKRDYYTGFLGPVDDLSNMKLFVNLRSMQLIGNKALLYTGGGLTAASVVEKEWQETENKAKTLLDVLRNKAV